MKLVTGHEMKLLDQQAIEAFGIPGIVLMENAGIRVVEAINHYFQGQILGKRIYIFAGKGNNGGDGLVIARHLANFGADVKVFLACKPEELKGDARINYDIVRHLALNIYTIDTDKDMQRADIALTYADLIVDALFGTGFRGSASGMMADLINLINDSGKPVLAVDIPSGLEADTGQIYGPCVKADVTVTFGYPKLGLCLEPGAQYVGRLWLADISLPANLKDATVKNHLITQEQVVQWLPMREAGGHKGTFGHVLVIGGSEGMSGAVYLASQAALRAGAGLVTAAIPQSLNPVMEMKTSEVMTRPLPETEEHSISMEALPTLLNLAKKCDAVVMGPGLSRNSNTLSLVRNFLSSVAKPVVVDADALMALAEDPVFKPNPQATLVLTPHPGEMARLMGLSTKEVQNNRLNMVRTCAAKWNGVAILKGAKTLVADAQGQVYLNITGNSGMGTAGSGDVLAGMVGSFLAQGMAPLKAAATAVYSHGLAGDLGAEKLGERSLMATHLLQFLSPALKMLEEKQKEGQKAVRHRLQQIF